MNAPLSFNRWLKQLRADLDMTQERLAEQVGCSVETVRAFETGRRRPSRAMADRMATVLQLDPAEQDDFVRLARSPVERAAPSADSSATPASAPAPPSLGAARLPTPPTAFIGREQDVADISRRLMEPACRLLTLIGAGGTGKTRLSLRVASELSDRFRDGVSFVPLAQVMAPENVAAAIADVIGCALSATQSAEQSLLAFLRERSMLLVLDNLEHLLEATPLFAAILREAPDVRMLVTSRERLRLSGEWVYEVQGLATPRDNSRAAIDRSDSVVLFLERARHVRGDFEITPDNRAAVADICRLLEGMPLGIELAAAWVRALTPGEIATEVRRGLDFLALSDRDADPRHRSMRAAITHSWTLLTPTERRVMARLAVFRGGCTREAAENVAGATLPALMSLLDKSLLRRSQAGRYEMHELVRQFAADQLEGEPDDAAATRERHGAFYAAWIRSRKRMLQSSQQQAAVAEITVEIDNVRAAWQYAAAERRVDLLWMMTEGTVLTWFYELRSWYREAEALTKAAVKAMLQAPLSSRREELLYANLIGNQGWHTFRCGDPAEGVRLLRQSLEILSPGDHPEFLFISLEQLTYLMLFTGDFDQVVELHEAQGPVVQRIADPWLLAHARFQEAAVYVDRAPDLAYVRFREGLPYMRSVGDRYVVILTLCHLGEIALALGQIDEAEQSFAEAHDLSAGIGNSMGEASGLSGLAMVAGARGQWHDAISYSLEAVARARVVGDTWTLSKALVVLGAAEAGGGDRVSAERNLVEAISIAVPATALPVALDACLRLIALDLQDGRLDQALPSLLAFVRRHPAAGRHLAQRAEQIWTSLAPQLDPAVHEAAERIAAGPPEQIVKLIGEYLAARPTWREVPVRSA